MQDKHLQETITKVFAREAQAIALLSASVIEIECAAKLCANCNGRIIVTGLGKSGFAARKIAATFSSVGVPAQFLHPVEALHGDIGAISANDVAICISKSGHTQELALVIAHFERVGIPIVAITSDSESSLAKMAQVTIKLPSHDECDPLNIVPTTSFVCTIAAGDAILSGVILLKGITREQFRQFHPGGSLGHRLTKISAVMHVDDSIPHVPSSATLRDAIVEISRKGFGTTLVMEGQTLLGIVTDGDVRRAMQSASSVNQLNDNVMQYATKLPRTISPCAIVEDALRIFEEHKITSLVVLDGDNVVGFVHIHDILERKVV